VKFFDVIDWNAPRIVLAFKNPDQRRSRSAGKEDLNRNVGYDACPTVTGKIGVSFEDLRVLRGSAQAFIPKFLGESLVNSLFECITFGCSAQRCLIGRSGCRSLY
jgi:hypothetical protein